MAEEKLGRRGPVKAHPLAYETKHSSRPLPRNDTRGTFRRGTSYLESAPRPFQRPRVLDMVAGWPPVGYPKFRFSSREEVSILAGSMCNRGHLFFVGAMVLR